MKRPKAQPAQAKLAGTLHEWDTLPLPLPFPLPSPYRGQLQLLLLLLQTRHLPSWQQQQINTLAFVLPLWVQTINKYHFTRRGLSSSRLQDSFANVSRGTALRALATPPDWQIYRLLIKVQATWPSVSSAKESQLIAAQ